MRRSIAPVVIAAGGTGGHVFPALAVADILRERGIPVVWFGTRRGLEASVVPNAGYPIRWIPVAGLRGKSLWARITGPVRLLAAIGQSTWGLARLRPRAVLGMGGFVTGPVGVAAKLTGCRLVLHEQNAVAGFTNRVLSRFASIVFSAMPDVFASARNAIVVGNPLRDEIEFAADTKHKMAHGVVDTVNFGDGNKHAINDAHSELSKHQPMNNDDHVLRVLIVGGSQGAQVLNNVVPEVIKGINFSMKVVHQTGLSMYETVQDRYASHTNEIHDVDVQKFIENMKDAYLEADVVVCRSGAMTVSEIAAMSLPSVLVPFPYAVDDHQTKNAKFLEAAGAAVVLSQDILSVERLTHVLTEFHFNRGELRAMGTAARGCHRPNAALKIADALVGKCSKVISSNHEVSA